MGTYATQSVDTAGTAITYAAVSAADRFLPADRCFLHVKNTAASTVTATIVTPGTQDGLAIADRVVVIPATGERMIRVPPQYYASSDGLADVQFTGTTIASCTAAVILV